MSDTFFFSLHCRQQQKNKNKHFVLFTLVPNRCDELLGIFSVKKQKRKHGVRYSSNKTNDSNDMREFVSMKIPYELNGIYKRLEFEIKCEKKNYSRGCVTCSTMIYHQMTIAFKIFRNNLLLTDKFISIRSISSPIISTIFSPCTNINSFNWSILWKPFTSCSNESSEKERENK